jgi:hypothetical protein
MVQTLEACPLEQNERANLHVTLLGRLAERARTIHAEG